MVSAGCRRWWSGTCKTSDRKSTRLNSSHSQISYAVFCLKKKKNAHEQHPADIHDVPRAGSDAEAPVYAPGRRRAGARVGCAGPSHIGTEPPEGSDGGRDL